MVYIAQYILSILPFAQRPSQSQSLARIDGLASNPFHQHTPKKSIAIVGAGSAGLAMLKTMFDLPEDIRSGWDIVLYEQRRNVGGIWLLDPVPPHPPTLPETPLYPRLVTNEPHPTMTYPGFPYPPGTALFPRHEYVEQYHVDYSVHHNLTGHIHLNHTVHAAGWVGNHTHGRWELEVHRTKEGRVGEVIKAQFDHLIVANGHNHYPRLPRWKGTEDWLAHPSFGGRKRELIHSIFYCEAEAYANKTVVIVGNGASGRDAALQVGSVAKKVYQSLREGSEATPGANVTAKPEISYFNASSIVFSDGTSLEDVDSVISATGYELLVPFLTRVPNNNTEAIPPLIESRKANYNCTTAPSLVTNSRYIFPLYQHIFSLSPSLPPTALAFIGLPELIAFCPSDIAQALAVSHAIADPSVLPSYSQMLDDLVRRENHLQTMGHDPYRVGHKMLGGEDEAQEYQDQLVDYLKTQNKLPADGRKFVEQWRGNARRHSSLLRRAWNRVVYRGEEKSWLHGIETESQWAGLMDRLVDWQEKWEMFSST